MKKVFLNKFWILIASFIVIGSSADEIKNFPVDSVIHLRKNTNNNQVHYAVKVDDNCRPLLKKPVLGYWLMLENGKNETVTKNLRR